jgi:hypothetical protein
MLTIVSATRHNEAVFSDRTFLGCSIARLRKLGVDLDVRVTFRHIQGVGLSEIYNAAIEDGQPNDPMLLVHDDVSLEDMLIEEKLALALGELDIVGIAGGDPPDQAPGWYNKDAWAASGYVPHADGSRLKSLLRSEPNMYYGPSPRLCRVIDGHFMAVVPARVLEAGTRFDPQFTFNHYDLDFCHSARAAGLKIGT